MIHSNQNGQVYNYSKNIWSCITSTFPFTHTALTDQIVNSKYNFVETPRKFFITKLSIRKLGFSSMLIIMHYYN